MQTRTWQVRVIATRPLPDTAGNRFRLDGHGMARLFRQLPMPIHTFMRTDPPPNNTLAPPGTHMRTFSFALAQPDMSHTTSAPACYCT